MAIRQAVEAVGKRLSPATRDDGFLASAVLLHLGFGEKLVGLLEELGADVTLMPWFEAVPAHALGDRRFLANIPQEARPAAETIYDHITRLRSHLPAATKRPLVPAGRSGTACPTVQGTARSSLTS